jgi:Uma2 family endonuclease
LQNGQLRYYVSSEPRVRGRKAIDLAIDPPPDLAIEVEITPPSIDKLPIYATLGIAEVWRYDGRQLRIDRLQADGVYSRQATSGELPLLPPSEVERFLDQRDKIGETTWIRSFRAWVQSIAKQGGDVGEGLA